VTQNDRPPAWLEIAISLLALASIGLLVIEFLTPLTEYWIQVIYDLDLAICAVFALDFAVELRKARDRSGYLKWHWIDIIALLPAYLFYFLETTTLLGAGLRALRLIRLGRFFAVTARIRRTRIMHADEEKRSNKRKSIGYATVAAVIAVFYITFRQDIDILPFGSYVTKSLVSGFIFFVALAAAEAIVFWKVSKVEDPASRASIGRATKAVIVGLASIGIVSLIFEELMVLALSLGVVGLILSFSLSPLISNFISWIYISTKKLYSVGDSVKIGDAVGIVTSIGYLTTQLVEVGDASLYKSLTGGTMTVPNSMVLSEIVTTKGPRKSPFYIADITFDLAYESDLEAVKEIIGRIVEEYLSPYVDRMVNSCTGRECDGKFMDAIRSGPKIVYRPEMTWVEVKVIYPIPPAVYVQSISDITERVLREFNARPEAVKFPLGRSR